MRKVSAWLGAAMLFMLVSVRADAANDVLKPYVVLILDTSDSMLIPTGSGPTTCGKADNRLNHAVCAINNIINSYGDMVFSFGRFRETTSGTGTPGSQVCDGDGNQNGNVADTFPASGGDVCNTQGAYCADCAAQPDNTASVAKTCTYCATPGVQSTCASGYTCATGNYCAKTALPVDATTICNGPDRCDMATGRCIPGLTGQSGLCTNADSNYEVLAPLIDGQNANAGEFVDGICNTCNTNGGGSLNPEIWGVGKRTFTPLSGTLAGAKRYWEGNQATDATTIWATGICSGGTNAGGSCTTNSQCPSGTCAVNAGADPINRDPTNMVFLSGNSSATCNSNKTSCQPYSEAGVCTGGAAGSNNGSTCIANSQCTGGGTCSSTTSCTDSADSDGDGKVNDGCPINTGNNSGAESGAQCNDSVDSDGDGVVNDGCPGVCTGANCCCASQCRPYVTILLTDGQETCGSFGAFPTPSPGTTLANAQALAIMSPRNDRVNISAISGNGTTVTVTTAQPHPFAVGDEIQVVGVTGYNTIKRVSAVTSTTTIQYLDTPSSTATLTASSFIGHSAFNKNYNVQLKPIGFGVSPGDQQIEDMAHAGGAADLPGINEGFYAADQSDLQLAISQILADSVRGELCNQKDDDCDEKVDEDFPQVGDQTAVPPIPAQMCDNGLQGACYRTGIFVCDGAGGVTCNAPSATGTAEVCNGIDDDCDGLIDNGITCSSCVPQPETCNNADQDCDNVPDKICRCSNDNTKACSSAAQCGGAPNQCNCTNLTRPCFIGTGAGACSGIETCITGSYQGCTAVSGTEVCDGVDNDCDGVCDGFDLQCSEVKNTCTNTSATSCPESDNPGSPNYKSCSGGSNAGKGCTVAGDCPSGTCVATPPIPQNICRPGTRSCPINGACTAQPGKTLTACQGEVKACGPDTPAGTAGCDGCDGLDNDCDNVIDENFIPSDCSNNCGTGTTQCVNGVITCNSTAQATDTTCNNIDDDCDNKIDEEWTCPDLDNDGVCDPCGQGTVCNGVPKCVDGSVVCQGGPINGEVCNCLDDDCDGIIDEDPAPGSDICPTGSTCVPGSCQCAFGCVAGEFPCPLGKKCETSKLCSAASTNHGQACTVAGDCPGGTCDDANFCVNDPCFNHNCPAVNGNMQTCIPDPQFPNTPECVDVCQLINSGQEGFSMCPTGFVCVGAQGACKPDNCVTFPDKCTTDQACVNGTCVSNPCANVNCTETGTYCIGGTCVQSCSEVTCATGQRCRQGVCEPDPCGHACPFGQACNDTTGQCIADPCKDITCQSGQWCNPNDGQCEDDPCVTSNIKCPNPGEVCRGGTCLDPDSLRPDAAGEAHVTVGGGGGCNTTGGGSSGAALLLALGLVLSRRRDRRAASSAKRTAGGAS